MIANDTLRLHRSIAVIATLAAAACGPGQKAGPAKPGAPGHAKPKTAPKSDSERTPTLTWVFDARLYAGEQTTPGIVYAGDKLAVSIDTTQRFGDSTTANFTGTPVPFFPTTQPAAALEVSVPVGLREFYFAANGNGFVLDDGACAAQPAAPAARVPESPLSPNAIPCTSDLQRTADAEHWSRDPGHPASVMRCTSSQSLIAHGVPQRPMRLLESLGGGTSACTPLTLKPSEADTIVSATVNLTVGAKRTPYAAQATDGVWAVETTLDDAGTVRGEVELHYQSGLSRKQALPAIRVRTQDEHSLVRVQTELMSSNDHRSVNFGVALTPVRRAFFEDGPWHGCWGMNGISPSAVIRFAGDKTTLLQFGLGVSVFATPAMSFNTGILFGTTDGSTYWNWKPNVFIGFAIDPALLLEARNTNK